MRLATPSPSFGSSRGQRYHRRRIEAAGRAAPRDDLTTLSHARRAKLSKLCWNEPLADRLIRQRFWEGVMNHLARIAVVAGSLVALAACGSGEPGRVGGGAAVGAGSGAVIGAVAGPIGAGAGAVIGAGVGGTTAAVTSPRTVNLGPPPKVTP
jgi:hypothetical protein